MRKWKWAAALLLLIGIIAAAAADVRVTRQVEQMAEEMGVDVDAPVKKKTPEWVEKWQGIREDRRFTFLFVPVVFLIVLVLVLIAGPRPSDPIHINQAEAAVLAEQIEDEYMAREQLVEPQDPSSAADDAEDWALTELAMPKPLSVRREADCVIFTWEPVEFAEGYTVWRKAGDENWQRIGRTKKGETVYADYSIESRVMYYYTVRAYRIVDGQRIMSHRDPFGLSVYVEKGNVLPAPEVFRGKDKKGRPAVAWKPVSGSRVYRILRREPGEDWTLLARVPASGESVYHDRDAEPGVPYDYTVCACVIINKIPVPGKYDDAGITIKA